MGAANAEIWRLRARLEALNNYGVSKLWLPDLLKHFRVTKFSILSELQLETLSLYLCTDHAKGFLCTQGRNHDLRLLNIPDGVHKAVEFGIHQGTVMVLVIVQLHNGSDLHSAISLPEGSSVEDLDYLAGEFDVVTNVVLGEVSVEEIIHSLP
jgi:hypothetical protein